MGVAGGRGVVGSGGRVVGSSTRGGGIGDDCPPPGTIGSSGLGDVLSAIGGGRVSGLSATIAVQRIVGLPVVPGGHIHAGLCPCV